MYAISLINDGIPIIIHRPGTSDIKVYDAKITREVNKFDSLTFTIYPGNPGFDHMTPFSTTVIVENLRSREVEFEGRVISPAPSMDSAGIVSIDVTCEGLMGFLCDSFQKYTEEAHYSDFATKTGLQSYIETLLDRHNAVVEEAKRIYPGSITLQTFDTSSGVTKSISRGSTWDNISSKLLDVFGGEMRVYRGNDSLLYLDYAESLGTTRSTQLRVARNLQESSQEADPTGVVTRLYPYGCKLSRESVDADGNAFEEETEERLGVEDVNDGSPYIEDPVALARYGVIEGYQEWDDITQPVNLLTKAREWLGENNKLTLTTSIRAVDLSLLGYDADSFKIHDSYPVYNPLIGLDETLEIVKQVIDINEPQNSTIDLGDVSYTLSAGIAGGNMPDEYYEFVSQTNTNITNVSNSTRVNSASLKVFEDRINSTATQVTIINDGMSTISTKLTELEQTPDSWTYNFVTSLESQLANLDSTYSTNYSEQLKYIKFIDGEIWLGRDADEGQDDFKVVISNERIRFLQNNTEVAYISNQSLSITDATVMNRLNLGIFTFVPRKNGNLTLRYMGD